MSRVHVAGNQLQLRRHLDEGQNLLNEDEKWQAVLDRNSNRDGTFVFAVRSTGIYCKPSCPARRPSREQVLFFAAADEAQRSGFRPCRRCRPQEIARPPHVELIDRVCRYIEDNLDRKLTLSVLGAEAGISPYHLQRTFKQMVGISPRQYAETLRLAKMKNSLRNGQTVTKALYGAGFSSRSRLYETTPIRFGISPGLIRRGGLGMRIEYTTVKIPLGRLLVGVTQRGVCAVCMGSSDAAVEAALAEDYPLAELHRDNVGMRKWVNQFVDYFAGRHADLNLPVDVQATAFQFRVWKEIQSVPYGDTTTYRKIANAMGAPQAARAVARACATNPVALVVPCHRVIGEDGGLRGYRWGKKRKEALLSLEQTAHAGTANPG